MTTNTFIIIFRERFAFSAVNTRIICTTFFDEGTFLNIRSLQNIFKVRKISKIMFLALNFSKKSNVLPNSALVSEMGQLKEIKAHHYAN